MDYSLNDDLKAAQAEYVEASKHQSTLALKDELHKAFLKVHEAKCAISNYHTANSKDYSEVREAMIESNRARVANKEQETA